MMSRIEITGTVDNQHQLCLTVPEEIRPGRVRVTLEVADDEEDDWRRDTGAIWARDYDPREDIYTVQDGDPINEAQ
jgi:hypothetical protein